jgi:hypothetical protein
MQDQREIHRKLLALCEFVKSTELSFPNRQTILSLLGAVLAINADSSRGSPEHALRAYQQEESGSITDFAVHIAVNRFG